MTRISAALAALSLAGASCAVAPPPPEGFVFGVMGDTPYTAREEPRFVEMIARMNAEPLAFVIHVGDIKAGGGSPCSDELYERRLAQFDTSGHPLVYTPGDNEWTDCRRKSNGAHDPLERLARLREVFFAGRSALGHGHLDTVGEDAAGGCGAYPENRLWHYRGVRFATINVPGDTNNEGIDAASDAEALCRDAANARWIDHAADLVEQHGDRALVIATQADPWLNPKTREFHALTAHVAAVARRLRRPVLFVHGDTHIYRYDTPFKDSYGEPVPNALRLETYGSPFVGWVRVTVDPDFPGVFIVEPKLVAVAP